MPKKAASKWTIAFLAGFILTAGVILMLVVVPGFFVRETCPTGQVGQINEVEVKVEKMSGKSGYETMYFEVKDCVESIKYEEGKLKVKYTTTDNPVPYQTDAKWVNADDTPLDLTGSGSYLLRVYEDRVKVMVVE